MLKDAETTDCEWQEESFLLNRSCHQACRARTHSKKPHQCRHESVWSLVPKCPFYSYLHLCLTAHCGLLLTCRRKCMCQPPEVTNRQPSQKDTKSSKRYSRPTIPHKVSLQHLSLTENPSSSVRDQRMTLKTRNIIQSQIWWLRLVSTVSRARMIGRSQIGCFLKTLFVPMSR